MTEQPNPTGWRRGYAFAKRHSTLLWGVLLTTFGAAYVWQARGDFADAAVLIADSHPVWIALIAIAQLAVLALTGLTYQSVLRRLGHRLTLRRLVELHLQRKVVGTITPGGGPASVYVFVRGLGRHAVSSDDALFTTGVRSLAGYASYMSLILPIAFLVRPSGLFLIGTAGAVALFVLITTLVLVLLRNEAASEALGRRLPERVASMIQRARGHGLRLPDLVVPVTLSFAGQIANVATLYAALLATGHSPSLVTVLVGYTLTTMFVTLSPVFQGIGIVEMTMAVTLQQLGVPTTAAIGATLLYRLATVWLPLLLGFGAQAGQTLPARITATYRNRLARRPNALTSPSSPRTTWRRVSTRVRQAIRPVLGVRNVTVVSVSVVTAPLAVMPGITDHLTALHGLWFALLVMLAELMA